MACILTDYRYILYTIVNPLKATGKEEGLFVIKNTYPVRGFVLEGKLRLKKNNLILLVGVFTFFK